MIHKHVKLNGTLFYMACYNDHCIIISIENSSNKVKSKLELTGSLLTIKIKLSHI